MERLVKGEFDDCSEKMTSGEIIGVLFALKPLADQTTVASQMTILKNLPKW